MYYMATGKLTFLDKEAKDVALISKSRASMELFGFHYLNWIWSSEMHLLIILEDNVGVTCLINTLPFTEQTILWELLFC